MKTNFKKLFGCFFAGMILFSLSACGQQTAETPQSSQTPSQAEPDSGAATSTLETTPGGEPSADGSSGTLVIYFSATGNTKAVAETIAETAGGDLYEIVPEEPYTSDDLNWTNESSRVSKEHNDPDFRPVIAGELPDLAGYDTVFIGYPSWWGEAPNIVWTLMEGVDFSGKTIIPFCTSSSSGLGSSAETLEAFTTDATWLEGQRFRSGVADGDVADWVKGLGRSLSHEY